MERTASTIAFRRPAPPGRTGSGARRFLAVLLLPAAALLLTTACSSAHPSIRPGRLPKATGAPSRPHLAGTVERGIASWYGPGFDGRRTASGERYRRNLLTAAHRTLPFGTQVQVKNVETGSAVVVKINDRGPFARGRIIDLSFAAARELGVATAGTAEVEVVVLGEDDFGADSRTRYTVQVGVYSDPNLAVQLHRDLKRIYPEAYVHSDGIWNRVQVGLFTDRDNAEDLRRELAVMGIPALVVAAH